TVTVAASVGNKTQTESAVAGAPSQLAFTTTPRTFTAGLCATSANVMTVALEDGSGYGVTTGGLFTATSGTSGTATWYTGTNCTGSRATGSMVFTIAAGQSTVAVYYEDTVPGSPVITVAAGVGNKTQTESVVAGAASQLAFTTNPRTFTAGLCATSANVITVALEDGSGNGVTTGALFTATSGTS